MLDLPHFARDYWPTRDWRTAPPQDQGLDPAALADAQAYLADRAPHIDSLLVVRHGYLVHESYHNRTGPDALHALKSVTKSVMGALIGIAIRAGDLAGVDEQLGYVMPEVFATVPDRALREITIRDLLTMRSGLDWAEYGPGLLQMTASPHWVQHVLELPLAHPPGTFFNYSTGDTHLLSAVLHHLTDLSALEYADLYLFDPLGITRRRWVADPQGVSIGGTELLLTPRDMAKFGYLYLNGGRWDDQAILPANWVQDSAEYHTSFEPTEQNPCAEWGYGYLWWLRSQGRYPSLIAVGYGGQFVFVVPALDLVVVMTGGLTAVPETFRDSRMLCQFNLVEDFIVPAIIG
jgi:CubicO group peptidase (beta-lactamase class C family)